MSLNIRRGTNADQAAVFRLWREGLVDEAAEMLEEKLKKAVVSPISNELGVHESENEHEEEDEVAADLDTMHLAENLGATATGCPGKHSTQSRQQARLQHFHEIWISRILI